MAGKISAEDPPSAEEYARISGDIIDHGNVALALSMAGEIGVMKVLSEADTPLTSIEICEKANVRERYVRELLGALVSARLLQLAPGTGGENGVEPKYLVHPPLRDGFKKAGVRAMFVTRSVEHFKMVKEMFSKDGPIGHGEGHFAHHHGEDSYAHLEEMNKMSLDATIQALLSAPGLREKLEKGIEVAELGSGTGQTCLRLATMFPNSRFTLTDIMQGPLDRAKKSAETQNLTNVSFDVVDGTKPPAEWKGRFDWMFTAFVIHHIADKQAAVNKVSESLQPGGYFSVIDGFKSDYLTKNTGNMEAAALYAISPFFFLPHWEPDAEPLVGNLGREHMRKMAEQAGLRILGFQKFAGNFTGTAVCTCQKD